MGLCRAAQESCLLSEERVSKVFRCSAKPNITSVQAPLDSMCTVCKYSPLETVYMQTPVDHASYEIRGTEDGA